MRKLWIPILLIFLTFELHAQKKINARETFGEAYEYYLSNDYSEALFSFDLLIKAGYGNSNVSYLSGICNLNLPGREKKASACLEDAIKNISENYTEGSFDEPAAPLQAYYYLAQSYRISGDFIKSGEMLHILQDRIDTLQDKNTLALINHELDYSKNAAILMKIPVTLNITNAGNTINSNLDELNPVYLDYLLIDAKPQLNQHKS